jgi:hypothetical protein
MQKLLFLACLCASLAFAQTPDTTCSPANQKTLKEIHHNGIMNPKFLPSLDDGNIRWVNVVVRQCKLDFFTDKNMRYQQNLQGRRIALGVLSTPQWPVVKLHLEKIAAAVDAATTGSYIEVDLT